MLSKGEWLLCTDAVSRPIVLAKVLGADGRLYRERFLIDTGADRTVFSAALLSALQATVHSPTPGIGLTGIGGQSSYVLLVTTFELLSEDGRTVRIHGEYAAFTDPSATEMSILGRDVLYNFDLILGRSHQEILLLAPRHQYRVVQT